MSGFCRCINPQAVVAATAFFIANCDYTQSQQLGMILCICPLFPQCS